MRDESNFVEQLLLERYGYDIAPYEVSFLEKSLGNRMSSRGNPTFANYLELISRDEVEAKALYDSLHIGFSEFFRDPVAFAYLERLILPMLIEKKRSGQDRELRIWSAACAAGQEIYSVAILMDEALRRDDRGLISRFFATDIDQVALTVARAGNYDASALGRTSMGRVSAYFNQDADDFAILPRIRQAVDFSDFDLIADNGQCPPISIYGNFDLVFCSNVLFYYKPAYQLRILEKLESCVAPGGFLIAGEAERDIVARHRFKEVFAASAIFQAEAEGGDF